MNERTRDAMAVHNASRANYWLCEVLLHHDGARHATTQESMCAYIFLASKARQQALAAYKRLWETGSDCRSVAEVRCD